MQAYRVELKPTDPLFTHLCQSLELQPKKLYIQTKNPNWDQHLWQTFDNSLTIVGTRNPDPRSVQLVHKVVNDLRGTHLCILSGLARGIDGAAHRAALQAGIPTIAVIGSGLDCLYPAEHLNLADQILDAGGIIISEHEGTMPGLKGNFVKRNRLLAHWCKAVWLVQAPAHSGARHTVDFAYKSHKSVYVSGCIPGDPGFELNESLLLKESCNPLWRATDLELDFKLGRKAQAARASAELQNPLQMRLLDEIARRSPVYTRGEIPLEDLLQWASLQSWSPSDLFEALDQLIEKRILRDDASRLVLNASI